MLANYESEWLSASSLSSTFSSVWAKCFMSTIAKKSYQNEAHKNKQSVKLFNLTFVDTDLFFLILEKILPAAQ